MKQILLDMESGVISTVSAPVPSLTNNSLSISTAVSLISAGTERMLVTFGKSSYLDKARQQPEKVKDVLDKLKTDGLATTFEAVKSKLAQPVPLGYSNVGVVTGVGRGVSEFKIGDRVVSNGSHADIVSVKQHLCARIPDSVDDESAAFTVVGSISLQGIRLAEPTLGEAFVVIGAGVIGLLTIQLLRANGCRVLAVDLDQDKLELASKFGAEIFNSNSNDNLLNFANLFSRGRGVDGVIITATTDSNAPIKQSAQICRKRARIVLVGVVGLNLDRADFYEKEISFQVSCSYGPGRYDEAYENDSHDYPVGFVRWTEQRNFEAFLDMLASKAVDVSSLISKRFLFSDANNAYQELLTNKSVIGILLEYESREVKSFSRSITISDGSELINQSPTLAFVGAGNYASRVLIPAFKKTDVNLHTVVTANGLNSVVHGKKGGFLRASTSFEEVLKDPEINTLVIATQHNDHAEQVLDGLKFGKNVWVEKPLAIDHPGLNSIEQLYRDFQKNNETYPQLMIGFNRRFAPHVVKMRELLLTEKSAKSIMITINAGFIEPHHWTQNPQKGGGRIVGECCHFIDLMRFLVGTKIVSIAGRAMVSKHDGKIIDDNASITLGFEDGSFGTIAYLANGAPSFPKERVEVFTNGKVLQLDNFRKLYGYGWKNFKKMNLYAQDKGQAGCTSAFVEALKSGVPCIPVDEIFEVSRVTIEAREILLNQ